MLDLVVTYIDCPLRVRWTHRHYPEASSCHTLSLYPEACHYVEGSCGGGKEVESEGEWEDIENGGMSGRRGNEERGGGK